MSDCVMSWHAGSGKWAGGSNAAVPHTGLSQPVYSNSGGLHADHNCSPRQTGHGQSFCTLAAALGMVAWYTPFCSMLSQQAMGEFTHRSYVECISRMACLVFGCLC